MKVSKIFIWGTIGLAISAIAVYASQVAKMSKQLYYSFDKVKIKQAVLAGVILGVKMKVENRGRLEADVLGYNLNISGNGQYLTTVTTTAPFVIKPFSSAIIEFDATINPTTLGGIANVFINSANIEGITLLTEGTITIKKFGIPIKIPISYTEKVSDYM